MIAPHQRDRQAHIIAIGAGKSIFNCRVPYRLFVLVMLLLQYENVNVKEPKTQEHKRISHIVAAKTAAPHITTCIR